MQRSSSPNLRVFAAAATFVALLSVGLLLATGALDGGSDDSQVSARTPAVLGGQSPPVSTATTQPSPAGDGQPLTAPFELPILMYHHISSAPAADELTAGLTVTDEDFGRQLAYLKCAGYTSITLAQLFQAIDGTTPLPAKGIILTFDDGYDDAYTDAFPALKDAGFTGSFAIITGFVEGGGPYATWAQLRKMRDAGMEITSHSATHIDLGAADDFSLHQQLYDSRAALAQRLGQDTPFLVYPAGEPFRSGSTARQQRVVAALREAGYRGALLAGPDSTMQDPATPFALSRVRVSGGEGLATFAASMGGPDPAATGC